jgi:hypothetical protein
MVAGWAILPNNTSSSLGSLSDCFNSTAFLFWA